MPTLALFVLTASMVSGAAVSIPQTVAPVVVEASISDGEVQHRVQGERTSAAALLDALIRLSEVHEAQDRLEIIVHSRVPVGALFDLKGLAEKVGFRDTRLFVAGADKRMMVEVSLKEPAVPYSGSL